MYRFLLICTIVVSGCGAANRQIVSERTIRAEVRESVYSACYRAVADTQGAKLAALTGRVHSQDEVVRRLFELNGDAINASFPQTYKLVRGLIPSKREAVYRIGRLACIEDLQ